MHLVVILRILGVMIMAFSMTVLPSFLLAVLFEDGNAVAFFAAFALTLLTGGLLWFPLRHHQGVLRTRDGFVITVLFWFVLALFGSLPFVLSPQDPLSFTDAFFESMSGLTTTGATVIGNIDGLAKSLLFYRQLLQWLGGMGIVVLAVAILPMLGIGGMQLYRAETPGPEKDSKLTPRITETAKALWYIYFSLTVVCALGYWLAGMNLFDAVSHSFATVAIGGFSTHDESIGFFDSAAVESIAVIFMLISAVNFSLHFLAWRKKRLHHYFQDSEFRFFLFLLLIVFACTVAVLVSNQTYPLKDAFRHALFQVVSIATTTGFVTQSFADWPSLLPVLLFFISFVGGCAGSTGGGIKVIRILLLFKQGLREIQRLIHPNAVIRIKLGDKPIPDRITDAIWGFVSVYILAFVFLVLVLMTMGLDQVTAWSAVGATINNLGPGLGEITLHYGELNDPAKWILCFSMLLGRLEVFTLLVLLTPTFWRR